MNRVAVVVLLGGIALLTTWAVAPAAPARLVASADVLEVLDQAGPVVADVDAQVARLRERLAAPPQFPPPSRDPFRFGQRPEPPRPVAPVVIGPAVPLEPPPPPLPQLVAITTNIVDGVVTRTAVLAEGDTVRIVKDGDAIGRFVVRSLSADAAELLDKITARAYRITLR